ncbi:MAG TPA: sugar ABC transporter ATP-binding protein, partial [Polyangiaceae bacterium]
MSAASIIELREVSKSFGSTQALREVSFDLAQGEVHALTGENGAGKSTLIKIISGVHTDYTGELYLDGRLYRFRSPEDAAHAGVASIHQELSLVGSMTVADNLLLGETGAAYGIWPGRAGRQATRRILSSVDLDLDPEQFVETLPLSIRQLIEIARALGRNARVLVMDEPTSALNQREASALFERIDRLRARGTSIIYISHRMEEIYRLADRITVLRDGMRVTTAPLGELPKSALIEKMVGKPLTRSRETRRFEFGEPVLTVRNLSVEDPRRPGQDLVDSISFTLRRGEILGLAGLVGSGASELLHALFGSLKTR